jgi:hypothetical protein
MIFINLKSWRNKSEKNRFMIEPNRFELMENKSRTVKFYLDAANPSNVEEEFTVEGFSIHNPIREVIFDAKLIANVIRPSLSFSKGEIEFKCFYGCDEKNCQPSEKFLIKF